MYVDESLMPPSAFLESPVSKTILNKNRSFNIGFDNLWTGNSYQINKFSQTEEVKVSSKASLTNDAVVTHEEMKEKLNYEISKNTEIIHILEQEHNSQKTELNELINNLTKQLSESNREKLSYQKELERMNYYISGMENLESWSKEKHKLVGEIEKLQLDNRNQEVIIESQKIQLSNMEKIQSIQERELENDIIRSSSLQLSNHEMRYESLMRAWRHKVLSLLVQQESNDILFLKEKHQMKIDLQNHTNEMDHLMNVLETTRLKLDSQHSQISMQNDFIKKLKRENDSCHNEIKMTNEDQMINQQNMEFVYSRLQQFQNDVHKEVEAKLQNASAKLDIFQRRLEYAMSRFPMIQASIVRSKNISVPSESNNPSIYEMPVDRMENEIFKFQEALLVSNKEIEQLRTERDQLITTIKQDSATFHQRINEKKHQLDEEMSRLQITVENLDRSLAKTLRELEIVKNENVRTKSNYDELLTEKYNETENLQAALNESRTDISTLSLEFSEYKRLSANDKRNLEEQIKQYEEIQRDRESFWTKRADQLVAECNLLKMTIRQEGILTKLKTRSHERIKCQESNNYFCEKTEMEWVMKEVENLTSELEINGNCS